MAVHRVFAGIVVTDKKSAIEWYSSFFNRDPDRIPNELEAVWDMGDAACVFIRVDADNAGHSSVALIVDDLDDQLTGIRGRGIETADIVEGSYRTLITFDPEGNRVVLVELRSNGAE